MKAELLPLNGKYYGTEVKVTTDNGYEYNIILWNPAEYEPSDRELNGLCTIDEWRKDIPIYVEKSDWYPDGVTSAKEELDICDNHFESRETYALALKIVEIINNSDSFRSLQNGRVELIGENTDTIPSVERP